MENENDNAFPTAQMLFLASLENADNIKDAIDVDKQFIDTLVNRKVPDLIVVDDAGFEVRRFEFGVDDMESLAAARKRIKDHESRHAEIREFVRQLVKDHPELEQTDFEPMAPLHRRSYAIWSEGYAATGEHGDATFFGSFNATSFDDAVQQYASSDPEAHKYLKKHDDGHWSYWACRLFDNEEDARKSFG